MGDRDAMIKVDDPEHYPYDQNGRYNAVGFFQGFLHVSAERNLFSNAADILLQPAYLFRRPEFVWKALSARPIWEGSASMRSPQSCRRSESQYRFQTTGYIARFVILPT